MPRLQLDERTMSEEGGIEATEQSISDLLGLPTDISELDVTQKKTFSKVAFNLYRETAIVSTVVFHLFESSEQTEACLARNQAIGAGLIARITKYMSAILALHLDKVREHGEVIMSLNRCITESAVNLIFFSESATSQDYDEYVMSSLKPERDQYRIILANITERGNELPIETRMLKSIKETFKNSGIEKIEELDRLPQRKNYKKILKAIGLDWAYPMLQGVPSHSIHGTWVDLVLHHLEKVPSGFRPKPNSSTPDPRLLCPISTIILYAVRAYLHKSFPVSHLGVSILLSRIENLIERNAEVERLHEEYLSNSQKRQ